ncbi:winged helix-turn-helix transcriptional regulator [Kribbella yunnanensis]|uniref:Winged helix-turn-helix transcriptional regulator n=1 Tax=Kribbella yunnanensis TaxID=190194 RepID=A0ABN2ISX9_9ACTN
MARPKTDGADDVHLLELFEVIGQRWTLRILWQLRSRPLSYREIAAEIPGLSTSVLTSRIRHLKSVGLVQHQGAGYELTPVGTELIAHVQHLRKWAEGIEFRSEP